MFSSILKTYQVSRQIMRCVRAWGGCFTTKSAASHVNKFVKTCQRCVCAQTETTLPSLSYFGRFPERIFQAYSLRNFWKMVVRAIIGSPVLSWEHCIMHFL